MIQKELEEIDENTKIGRDSWTTLKEMGAMTENVASQEWYQKLNKEEKQLLNALITA
jgi:hypothetical protein